MTPENATKYAAVLFLLGLGCVSLYVLGFDMVNNLPIPANIQVTISSGVTYALTTLSINHGNAIATSASKGDTHGIQ